MATNKETKENPYVLDVKTYEGTDNIHDYSHHYYLKTKDHDVKFEVSTRTSSCGSLQIMNFFVGKYQHTINLGLSLAQREEIFEKIKDTYDDHNHIFFIDCEDGNLERFFRDLGFQKCWTYFNPNSENNVNMWSLNRKTADQYYNEDSDGDW